VIFHSYVKLPEGKSSKPKIDRKARNLVNTSGFPKITQVTSIGSTIWHLFLGAGYQWYSNIQLVFSRYHLHRIPVILTSWSKKLPPDNPSIHVWFHMAFMCHKPSINHPIDHPIDQAFRGLKNHPFGDGDPIAARLQPETHRGEKFLDSPEIH